MINAEEETMGSTWQRSLRYTDANNCFLCKDPLKETPTISLVGRYLEDRLVVGSSVL